MTEEIFQENEDFELVKIVNTSLFKLRMKDGNELPELKVLHGMFTQPSLAIKAVDSYLELEKQKEAIKVAEDKGVIIPKKQKDTIIANG